MREGMLRLRVASACRIHSGNRQLCQHLGRKRNGPQNLVGYKLLDLKGQVEAAIRAKVADRRKALVSELSQLSRFDGHAKVTAFSGRGRRGPVAPKYRNPANPAETWAGRGLKPRWLAAAIKSGKELEDFAIAAPTKAAWAKAGTKGKMPKAAM